MFVPSLFSLQQYRLLHTHYWGLPLFCIIVLTALALTYLGKLHYPGLSNGLKIFPIFIHWVYYRYFSIKMRGEQTSIIQQQYGPEILKYFYIYYQFGIINYYVLRQIKLSRSGYYFHECSLWKGSSSYEVSPTVFSTDKKDPDCPLQSPS